MQKAIFLDRDGVINVDKSYVYQKESFEFCEGVFEALRHFQTLGYRLVVVTNQSGIGRGYYSEEDFLTLTEWMKEVLQRENIHLDAVYYCPHAPEMQCECRKPRSGMFEQALSALDIDVKQSWMIGDKQSDLQAALNIGITETILIGQTPCAEAKYCVNSLFDTIKHIQQ